MNKKIKKILKDLELCNGFYDFIIEPDDSQLLVDYIKSLQQENKQLKDNWNKLKEDLRKIRQLTFTKYNKNEWENCLSFNDDILPLIEKMKELEQGSDSNVKD